MTIAEPSVDTARSAPLPPHWVRVRVKDIAEVRLGRQRSPARATGPHMRPYLRAANVTWTGFDLSDVKEMDFRPSEQDTYRLRTGDVLLNEASGSLSEVGKPAVWNDQIENCCFQNTLIRVRSRGVLPSYIRAHFYYDAITGRFSIIARGVGIHHLGANGLANWEIVLPPLNEQRRIVAKLDELFSKLDAGVEALKRTQELLKRYRQSVLKAAVQGDLTREWREAHPDVEPASVLLDRIREEREKQLDGKRAKKEPPPLDASDLPGLPANWTLARGDDLFPFITSGSRGWAKYYADDGPMFLRVGNLDYASAHLDLSSVQRVLPPASAETKRTLVAQGDILVSVTADVGMVAVAPAGLGEAYINQHVALIRPVADVFAMYLGWMLASDYGQRQFRRLRRGATRSGLGLDDFLEVGIPLPPLAEQHAIAAQVERHLSIADAASSTLEASSQRVGRLRQSILQRAFAGKLVEQDASDEPASALLARIADEKAEAAPKPRNRKRTKPQERLF